MRFVIIFFLLFGVASADKDSEEHGHHRYKKDLTFLDLKENQKNVIRNILNQYRIEIKNYKNYKEHSEEQKQKIFLSQKFDEVKMQKIDQELSQKASNIQINFLKKIHSVLTIQQRQKFIYHIDEWEID